MELSILIPARREMFLARTVQDIIEHSEAETEIIVVLDGAWAEPEIPQHPMVNIVFLPVSVGQRKATDIAVKLARGKYVAKVDAHCAFDQGFDRKMIDFMKRVGDDVTAVPVMRNLWAFDWKCYHCGFKKYQGPTPEKCEQCGKGDKMRRKVMWVGKERPQSWSYCFDSEPHFQYFEQYKKRPETKAMLETFGYTETMSLQGSFFMATKERYLALDMGGDYGSWGNQGLQIACATWLSGGRVLVNHDTWYAHMFRTQGGDFSFPYENPGREVQKTKHSVKDALWNGTYPGQKLPVSWLIERFGPIPGWDADKIEELKRHEKMI
jgi:glycosyltransferase involved in cell wall biosynthesis